MKICAEENCNIEVEAWQTYCPKHYAIKMQEAQQKQGKEELPKMPVKPEVVEQQEKKVLPPEEIEREPLPEIDDRTSSIISQVAFKGAIELMANMNFEEKTFEELIGEIRTLTNEFYRIMVEKRK